MLSVLIKIAIELLSNALGSTADTPEITTP